MLLYAAEWDSVQTAQQYWAAYRKVLEKKWQHMTVASESEDTLTGAGDDGGFELRRRGPSSPAWKVSNLRYTDVLCSDSGQS